MPAAYLGRQVHGYLDVGGTLIDEPSNAQFGAYDGRHFLSLNSGRSRLDWSPELTTASVFIEGASEQVTIPIVQDQALDLGALVAVNADAMRVATEAGVAGAIAVDYSRARGATRGGSNPSPERTNSALFGAVRIEEGQITAPYDDLVQVQGRWPQAQPWYFGNTYSINDKSGIIPDADWTAGEFQMCCVVVDEVTVISGRGNLPDLDWAFTASGTTIQQGRWRPARTGVFLLPVPPTAGHLDIGPDPRGGSSIVARISVTTMFGNRIGKILELAP